MTSVDPIQAELEALRSELATLRAERGATEGTAAAGNGAASIADGATAAASAAARKVTGWLNEFDTQGVLRELQDALGEASSVAEQSVANRPLVIVGSALLLGFLVGRLSRGAR